ncbi:SHOCT domain-containing protein [Thiomicrolovo sp. ZZH C-3]
MHTFGMGWMWLWWLLPFIIIAAVLFVATGRNGRSRRSRALEILEERLARGEIDIATYEKLKAELTEND